MCAFWLEIVSVCVLWGENFLRAPPSADIYDIFTVPAFFDAPIGSMTALSRTVRKNVSGVGVGVQIQKKIP